MHERGAFPLGARNQALAAAPCDALACYVDGRVRIDAASKKAHFDSSDGRAKEASIVAGSLCWQLDFSRWSGRWT
jgi:hypothetical protein